MKSSDLEFSVIYHMPVLAILASFKYKLRYTKEQPVHEPWSLDTYSKIGVTLVLLIMNIVTNGLVCVIDSHSFWLFIISSYLGWQMNLIVAFFFVYFFVHLLLIFHLCSRVLSYFLFTILRRPHLLIVPISRKKPLRYQRQAHHWKFYQVNTISTRSIRSSEWDLLCYFFTTCDCSRALLIPSPKVILNSLFD